MRTTLDYFLLFLRGMAMGAADVVPGVSGGTIAFITGIYEELLSSISAIKPSLFTTLKEQGFAAVWKKVNGTFLVVLLSGVAVSVLSLAKLITYLLHHHPILLWSFFFGLIIASIWYVGKQITHWNFLAWAGLLVGAAFVLAVSMMPPLSPNSSYLFLFFAGAIAVCAMILPGISGSFILLLLGVYSTIMIGINDRDFLMIGIVGLGAIIGLLSFSKLLNYLLKNYHNTLIAVLTGFLVGSLWKIWPWKKDSEVFVKEQGIQQIQEITPNFQSLSAYLQTLTEEQAKPFKSYIEHNILPHTYESLNADVPSQLISAIVMAIIGFSLIFIIEFIAKRKHV